MDMLNSLVQSNPTPYYAYDLGRLKQTIDRAKKASERYGYHVHYAMKANANDNILACFLKAGFGIDCVSGQELQKALDSGFHAEQIAFAGVGKSDWEIDLALNNGIFTLNVESIEELIVINERAKRLGKNAKIALRLNPDVNAKTHHYITTGLEENKFGISEWQLNELFDCLETLEYVKLTGIHFHIGSQITSLEPFRNLCSRINHFQELFESRGFRLEHINAGGGLGVDYDHPDDLNKPNFDGFFELFSKFLQLRPYQSLHFELGRALVAQSGDLISRVLYVKKGRKTNFVILDAGMTELIRPALYQAFHKIENISQFNSKPTEFYDVVGPVCESSDCFGKAVNLPKTERGDLVAIRSAGAYGECMASSYNMRSLNPSFFYEAE
jgi:diaminopimelate decarboxylase